MEILLDTSALIFLFQGFRNKNIKPSQVMNLATRRDLTLLIPPAALDELFSIKPDSPRLIEDAKELLDLFQLLGNRVEITTDHTAIKEMEYDNPLDRTPRSLHAKERIATSLLKIVRTQSTVGTEIQTWKKEIDSIKSLPEISDKAMMTWLQGDIKGAPDKIDHLYALLKNFSMDYVFPEIIGTLLARMGHPPENCKMVLRRTKRYLALKAWAAHAQLEIYGQFVPPDFASKHPIFNMLRYSRNVWYDTAIASTAAYCELFVTEDVRLVNRCNFLHNRKCVHFRSILTRDFLAL
jgi:hypothetical protein